MTVTRSLRQGVIETGRRPHIALSLYTLNLIAALLFAVPMALLLDRAVGRNAAARGLEATLRLDVVLDFLRTERPALLDHFQAVGCGALLYAVLSAILTGGVIDTLRSPVRSPFLPRFLGGCGRFAFRFMRLLPYLAIVLGAVALLNLGLNRTILVAFDQSGRELAAFWAMRGKQGLLLIVLLMVAAVFDLARILTAVEDRRHMIGALLTSAGFVARHAGPITLLYALSLSLGLLAFVPYFALAQGILSPASILGVVIAQQALMLLRHGLRVAGLGSLFAFYRMTTGPTGPEPGEPPGRSAAVDSGSAAGRDASPSPDAGRRAFGGTSDSSRTHPARATRLLGGALVALALLLLVPIPGARTAGGRAATGRVISAASRDPIIAPTAAPAPLSRRVVSYRIDASLDPDRHRVIGRETILYRNETRAPMADLEFHLYPNAFSNSRSNYMRGGAWSDATFQAQLARTEREGTWGFMRIDSVRGPDGADLTGSAAVDETVMKVPLPAPVPPGGEARVEVAWETRLPRTLHRMGYWGEHHDVMQWFPKLGVFTDSGWRIYPFHRHSEFFADFGTYEVTLTAPKRVRVEATGLPGPVRDNPDGTRSVTYRAEDVHDFAWIADPNMVLERTIVSEGPYARAPVEIIYARQPGREGMTSRILGTVKAGLRYYGEHFMPYPYPRLVVDDLPMGLSGGMEYPMLFTVSLAAFLPRFDTAPEEVTLHEFGHQYWYGIMATNEFEEPWLDEGINSYVTRKAMDASLWRGRPGRTTSALFAYGAARVLDEGIAVRLADTTLNLDQLLGFGATPFRPSGHGLLGFRLSPLSLDLPGLQDAPFQASRQGYADAARNDPIVTASWAHFPGSYYETVYDKTDTVLETLDRMLGGNALDETLREYVRRFRFTHPTGRDFLGILQETAARRRPGLDLGPAIDQLVRGTATIDFAVTSLESRPAGEPRGFIPQGHAGEAPLDHRFPESPVEKPGAFETEVIVRRLGDAILPVDLLITFEDGTQLRGRWDGRATWKRFTYETKSRAREAIVDPDRIYAMDLDVNNDGLTLERQPRPLARLSLLWLFWLQNGLHLAGSLS